MVYSKYLRPSSGGITQDNPGNYFGNGSLGDVTISANTSMCAANDDSAIYESHFASLTVNSSTTLNLGFRRRAHVIYVQNDLNVQATGLSWNSHTEGKKISNQIKSCYFS